MTAVEEGSIAAVETVTSTRRVYHFKSRGLEGDMILERCEDPGCCVDEHGHADCGRLACPRCGFSGTMLSQQQAPSEPVPVACACGYIWIPDW